MGGGGGGEERNFGKKTLGSRRRKPKEVRDSVTIGGKWNWQHTPDVTVRSLVLGLPPLSRWSPFFIPFFYYSSFSRHGGVAKNAD